MNNTINKTTVIKTIKNLNLKAIRIISIKAFILSLTFLVKFHFSLSISLFIVSSLFLLQTVHFRASFKALFYFILQIRTPHLMIISSKLLIQLWFYLRLLLTINISHCSLHQKMQIHIMSLIRIELNSHTIIEMKVNTDLITLSSLKYITTPWISTISLKTMKMTIITMINLSKKMTEQTTSLMRIRLFLKLTKSLLQKSMRMLTSITL